MAQSNAQSVGPDARQADRNKYLDPAVLSRIARLELQARLIVEGFVSGLHRSPFQGYSVEFASHREYVWGDDIRHIDWKVQARTDRFYIKQYQEETNLSATFLLDASESMRYGEGREGRLGKYSYAAAAAAALGVLLLRQQDAVGLTVFDEGVRDHLPPSTRANQIRRFVHAIETARPRRKTSLTGVCAELAETLPRRGLVCLLSDLFVEPDDLRRGLQRLAHDGHDVVVLHVMDADELTFPFQSHTRFRGLEEAGSLTAHPRALRDGYLAAVERFSREVRRRCIQTRADYQLVSTADRLDAALLGFLGARAASARKRGGTGRAGNAGSQRRRRSARADTWSPRTGEGPPPEATRP